MTSVSTSSEELAISTESTVPTGWKGSLRRVLVKLEALADRANPILVKETRQALKSRQFVVSFLVVLIACWIASFAVVTIVGPDVYFIAAGSPMLLVYSMILAFPLILIVPYSAFRSLAAEQEDNTYDLLSITTLTTSQIVTGKLASAVVQMMVFLSAVSPCIAFTFLLRGVDTLTVVVLLGYLVLTSLALSIVALLAGTMAKVRYSQVLVSVLLVVLLFMVFSMSIAMMGAFISESYVYLRDVWFWVGNLAFLTMYITTFALLHASASAQIAFNSQNRSTPLRRIMLVQQACLLGWFTVPIISDGVQFLYEFLLVFAMLSGIYWYSMGALLTSEWPHLSRRVLRSLPQSQIGRIFLTWLNPGPGTGYMFCVANITMVLVVGLAVLSRYQLLATSWLGLDQCIYALVLGWCYIVAYLGLGRLLISLMRRFVFVSLTAGFLLQVILLMAGCGVPLVLAYMGSSLQFGNEYSLLHLTNPFWTLATLIDRGAIAAEALTALLILGPVAIIVLLLNIRLVAVEIQHHRRSVPQRVAEDEAALHPEPAPLPTNPWDDAPE